MLDSQLRMVHLRLSIAVAGRFLPEFACGCGQVHWKATKVVRVELSPDALALVRKEQARRPPAEQPDPFVWAACFEVVGELVRPGQPVRRGALSEVLSEDEIRAAFEFAPVPCA